MMERPCAAAEELLGGVLCSLRAGRAQEVAAAYADGQLPRAEHVRQHARQAIAALLLTDATLLFSPAQLALAALCAGLRKVGTSACLAGAACSYHVACARGSHKQGTRLLPEPQRDIR